MSGVSVSPPGIGATPASVNRELGAAVGDAVDVFDATAKLESRGYGDTTARRHGHHDTFDLAVSLLTGRDTPTRTVGHRGLLADLVKALGRMIVMLCGVVISLSCLPAGVGQTRVFVAGAAGWLCGQAVSAGVWHGLGTGRRPVAASIAVTMAPVLIAAAVMACVAVDSPAPLLWALWSMAASVLVILRPGLPLVVACCWAAWTSMASTIWLPQARVQVATALVVVAVVAASAVVRAEAGRWSPLPGGALTAATLGTLQAAAQITLLWAVLQFVGDASFFTVAVAGLVAGATSDPILELAYSLVRHVVTYPTSWRSGRRLTRSLGIAAVGVVVGASAATAWLLRAQLAPHIDAGPVLTATCLVAGLTAGTGLLLRAGSAAGATALAIVVACATMAALSLARHSSAIDITTTLLALTVGALAVTAVIAARHMSHPSAW